MQPVTDVELRFSKVDVSRYPDIHLIADDLDAVLWVLVVGEELAGVSSMTASDVASVATHVFRRSITRQRVAALLSANAALVAEVARTRPLQYRVMKRGADRIRHQSGAVVVVNPETAFTALQQVDQLLANRKGDVRMCDPYIDDKTLVALASIPRGSPIKLLTLNISDAAQFRRKLQAYDREYGNLEIRTSSTPDLHDRYLIDADQMWLMGQSLNGIGKKQSFMVAVGPDVRDLTRAGFDKRWATSPRFS
jgi:hypothetical protein